MKGICCQGFFSPPSQQIDQSVLHEDTIARNAAGTGAPLAFGRKLVILFAVLWK
jgi:hypothetical protein